MLPDIEPDDDKSIPSAESVFSCVEKKDNFLYPFIMSDEVMDAEEEFDLDMDIIEPPLARPQDIPRQKGTILKCVLDRYVRASTNLSPKESAKVKELLVEHNEKPLTRTDTIEYEILTTGRPVRVPLYSRTQSVGQGSNM